MKAAEFQICSQEDETKQGLLEGFTFRQWFLTGEYQRFFFGIRTRF